MATNRSGFFHMIDVYAICWNEERMMPFFLRHYADFARKIVVFDNHSTDSTRELAAEYPQTEVRSFGSARDCCGEMERMAIRQIAWQESRGHADWVAVVDCDEFLWHPSLLAYLTSCRSRQVTIPRPTGYEMVGPAFPEGSGRIHEQVQTGIRAPYMDKWIVFAPDSIEAMNFHVGCHRAEPVGDIVFDDNPELKLLHYKHLGLEYVVSRYRQLEHRRTSLDRQLGLCHHYAWTDEILAAWLAEAQSKAINVLQQ